MRHPPFHSKGPRRPSPKHFRGSPHAGRRGMRRMPPPIDLSRYINTAAPSEPEPAYVPTHRFADFALDPRLEANITAKGYTLPTPIQDQAIPRIISGDDLVGIANTGTGKTAAFLIPLINKCLKNPRERVLVMVPTRELATQIADELKAFARGLSIYGAVVVGGAGIGGQIAALRRDPHFVIGTPGRLKDLIERKVLVLSHVRTAVLDEADRMLDMGFVHDMRRILALLPPTYQGLFLSATLSSDIDKLIAEFLENPVTVRVKTRDTVAAIEQDIVRVPPGGHKLDVLHDLLVRPGFTKVLIFGRTKHGVERLSRDLLARGFKAESIHGNKSQGKRVKALDLFRQDHVQILVATDVAARGLDIAGVSHVINFDLPATHEDYIHRIGRTGRAGKTGTAITLVDSPYGTR